MKRFQSPLIIALTDRINLSMLALAIASLLCAAWWWAPVGLVLWVIMVLIMAQDPLLKMAKNLESRAPLAQRFDRQFQQVERAQINIFNTISNAEPKLRPMMKPIQEATDNLAGYAHNICQRMSVLENHRLVSGSTLNLETQINEVDKKLHETTDPIETREYTESKQALQSRLSDLKTVERQLNRTDAQLVSLSNELNRVITDIVRIQALDPKIAKDHAEQVVLTLKNLLEQLKSFDQEVAQL